MKKITSILCILSCIFLMNTSEIKAIENNDAEKIELIDRFFNNSIMLYDDKGTECSSDFRSKFIDDYQKKDFSPIINHLDKNEYSFITLLPSINMLVADTAQNGYIWELISHSQVHRVYVFATVSYNGNSGAYVSRTSARANFIKKGSQADSCGVDQAQSSVTVTTNESVDYVTYYPAAFVKFKDNKYSYRKEFAFKVMCHAGAQPTPFKFK